ncbi:glycosyltransferase family 4 protein [Solirhodobacter olei]|uniref:glycosyltransferase family 4 protein n=1 Tax=Solirhodobacter olei TaxID=2493082 RepID=UPI000FDBC855|nr:glycosyltransferase family 4 protein [Solirhodobacter olei]
MQDISRIEVIAPNLKRRLSGVTSTVLRLIPIQARQIGIVATGPGLPEDVPQIPLSRLFFLPRDRWRVWHARRNNEMILGLILRHVFRRRLKLLFTSAAQRHHTGLTKWLIGRQDRVIATSAKAARYLDRPAEVVMHGIDTQVFHPAPDRAALRAELDLPAEATIIGCFGRIRAQKGVDLLVGTALDLLPENPDLLFLFSGRTTRKHEAFRAELEARIAAAGLTDRIRFLGEVPWSRLVQLQQALDLCAAPARWEGFGLTPLEAMACGTPVVAADVGAYAELLTPATGTITPPGDQAALTGAIRAWVSDPPRLAAARPAARAHVEARFPIAREAAALIAVYRRLLA